MQRTTVILQEVLAERYRQDKMWGQQDHDPVDFLAILSEEVGEAAKEVVNWRFASLPQQQPEHLFRLRQELIQVAAVAVAMVEAIDRLEPGAEGR